MSAAFPLLYVAIAKATTGVTVVWSVILFMFEPRGELGMAQRA